MQALEEGFGVDRFGMVVESQVQNVGFIILGSQQGLGLRGRGSVCRI